MPDVDDVAGRRDVLLRAGPREERSRRCARVCSRRAEETLGKERSRAARVGETVCLTGGAELVAAEDTQECRNLQLSRLYERLELFVLLRARGYYTPNSRPMATSRSRVRTSRMLLSESACVGTRRRDHSREGAFVRELRPDRVKNETPVARKDTTEATLELEGRPPRARATAGRAGSRKPRHQSRPRPQRCVSVHGR